MIRWLLIFALALSASAQSYINRLDGVGYSPRFFTDTRTYVGWTFSGRATTDVVRLFELTNLFNQVLSGETNTASNLGTGWPTYDSKSGVSLRFNTWTNGTGLLSTSNNSTFTMSVAADGITDTLLRNSGALSVIGRSANSSGDPADISASANGQVLLRTSDLLSFGQLVMTNDYFSNVSFDTLVAGQSITWDATAKKWTNTTASSGVGITDFTNINVYSDSPTASNAKLWGFANKYSDFLSAISTNGGPVFQVNSNGYVKMGNVSSNYTTPITPLAIFDTRQHKLSLGGSSTGTNAISTQGTSLQDLLITAHQFWFEPNNAPGVMTLTPLGKLGVNTNTPDEQFHVNGNAKIQNLIIFPSSALQTLDTGTAILANASKIRVVGNGAAKTLNQTPTIADGTDGTTIYIWGTSNSNTVTIQDETAVPGCNIQLAGDVACTLGNGDILVLQFDSATSYWWEVTRSKRSGSALIVE